MYDVIGRSSDAIRSVPHIEWEINNMDAGKVR
ncbi:MAG: hypothetical protein RLZZ237_51 [Pseudomonadota bacterium]|jgi:hypothetical protein